MSGHSKWSTIKHKKAIKDARRGKLFTKLGRTITVAAQKVGQGTAKELYQDPPPALRVAVDNARAGSMPKENIVRAIERGLGGSTQGRLEEATFEGYGPEGVAIVVRCLTDNRNRTVSEIRSLFVRYGGSLGQAGSAAYVFGSDPDNPQFVIPVTDSEKARRVLELVNALDGHDDVQEVWANFDIEDSLLEGVE
ncbi:YebC/PmpR family DNA-binding transcriptional regulator [Candidatus Parcubacteria bacterium]|nr:YebC/PmpR family DNA-binding transcriptional regulator [Candidatus Parcubacteria bacterium]